MVKELRNKKGCVNMSIPKIIHYCWVGGNPKPKSVLYCIESWKKCCPDYEIKEWNETNYDFTKNQYMKEAYDAKKWGFVPDYARLDIVYNYGGIYLDTDVEMVRSFDDLLDKESFFGFEDTGENTYFVACGLGFGASKNNQLIRKLRDYYDDISFLNEDGTLNLKPAPQHNTPIFAEYGVTLDNKLQTIEGNVFYPAEYFCPKIFKTGKLTLTKNTFSIHHFSASWMDEAIVKEIQHSQKICLKYGNTLGHIILIAESSLEKYGFFGSIKHALIRIYEYFYTLLPIVKARFYKLFHREKSSNIILLDTSLGTKNVGDRIIMENCEKQLGKVLDLSNAQHISTHELNAKDFDGKYKFLCGTNILSCRMRQYGLWKLPRNLNSYHDITLLGVGVDSYNDKSDFYTRYLLHYMLSKNYIHSVRDSFAESCLNNMGFKNVINTGCPTMWKLTPEHCSKVPTEKATNVICTITDYCRDEQNDKKMLNILLSNYEKVYLWLQGSEDDDYIKSLGFKDKVIIVGNELDEYDKILNLTDLDYVGTRLHAGIRSLGALHRTIIISIDNRAESISKDTGLPIVLRNEVSEKLEKKINSTFVTTIDLPWDNIHKWIDQFKD